MPALGFGLSLVGGVIIAGFQLEGEDGVTITVCTTIPRSFQLESEDGVTITVFTTVPRSFQLEGEDGVTITVFTTVPRCFHRVHRLDSIPLLPLRRCASVCSSACIFRVLLLLSVGPAVTRLMYFSLLRLIVLTPLCFSSFISRGAPRQRA
jgi:hypothetical protein